MGAGTIDLRKPKWFSAIKVIVYFVWHTPRQTMPPKKKVFHDSDSDVESIELDEDGVESDGADDLVGEESEDDGAPDDVTFTQSKADALLKIKDALATIGKVKERQKARRRLRDDQFKQQKVRYSH